MVLTAIENTSVYCTTLERDSDPRGHHCERRDELPAPCEERSSYAMVCGQPYSVAGYVETRANRTLAKCLKAFSGPVAQPDRAAVS